jgi:hypothetical protein
MAITAPVPTADATDLVLIAEASALFAETGHPVPPKTLKRWAVKHGVTVERVGKGDVASWSDLLEVHAREVDRRNGRR